MGSRDVKTLMSALQHKGKPVHILERWTDCFLLVMFAVFPLWTGANGYAVITHAKYTFFRGAASIYLIGMVVITAEMFFIGAKESIDVKRFYRDISFSQKFILVYLTAILISALLSDFSDVVWIGNRRYEGFFTQLLYVGIFWGLASYGRPKPMHLLAFALAMSLNSFLVTAQFLGYNPFELYPQGLNFHDRYLAYTGEFLGTIGNSDLLSALLTIAVPLLVCGYMMLKEKWRWVLLISTVLSWWSLLLSEVSGGIVGIVVGVFLVIPVIMSDEQYQQRILVVGAIFCSVTAFFSAIEYSYIGKTLEFGFNPSEGTLIFFSTAIALVLLMKALNTFNTGGRRYYDKRIFYLVQAVTLIIVFLLLFSYSGTTCLLYEASQILHGNILDSFGSSRIAIWRNAMAVVPEKLFFGGGPDTLELRINLTFENTMKSGVLLRAAVDVAHNEYLNILANTGLISLTAYLAALISVYKRWVSREALVKPLLTWSLPLLCYCIQAFFGISQCVTAPFFWILFGLFESELRKGTVF